MSDKKPRSKSKIVISARELHSGTWSVSVERGSRFRKHGIMNQMTRGNEGCCQNGYSVQSAGDAILELLLAHAERLGIEFQIENLGTQREKERRARDEAYRSGASKTCPHCNREHAPSDLGACDW